jgi:hypothetical protein
MIDCMKRCKILSLVIMAILSLPFSVIGQNPYQIADTTKLWRTLRGGWGAFMVAGCGGTYTHIFEGEAIVDDQTYLKVYEATDSLYTNWGLTGYIREDTLTQKVYFHAGWEVGEGLIYNFDIEVGDSVYIDNYYMDFTDALLICDSIDSVAISSEYRKRYYLLPAYGSYYADIWIEGIGSIYGLLFSGVYGAGYAGGFSYLLCQSQNDTLIYSDTVFESCYINEFYPKILNEYYDTAYVGYEYEFQLMLSDTSFIDSISWIGETIPDEFTFNNATGVLYGIPSTSGSFPCVITVKNHDISLKTDILYADIVVLTPTYINEGISTEKIKFYPNPFTTSTTLKYTLNSPQTVTITFYDSYGRTVDQITQHQLQGLQKVVWTPEGLNEGVYYFTICTSLTATGKDDVVEQLATGKVVYW